MKIAFLAAFLGFARLAGGFQGPFDIWYDRDQPGNAGFIAYGNGKYVVIHGLIGSAVKSISTSPDLVTWRRTEHALPGGPHAFALKFLQGKFYLATDRGLAASEDGINWNFSPTRQQRLRGAGLPTEMDYSSWPAIISHSYRPTEQTGPTMHYPWNSAGFASAKISLSPFHRAQHCYRWTASLGKNSMGRSVVRSSSPMIYLWELAVKESLTQLMAYPGTSRQAWERTSRFEISLLPATSL